MWKKDKCRRECLVDKNVIMSLFGTLAIVNVSIKKASRLTTEECEEISDNKQQLHQIKQI